MENKKIRSVTASITALTLLMTGTFAWNAFDQEALNKTIGEALDAGARLHDDFDGSNKDVYIENYGEEGQEMVYARIRLDEYMEYGTGAGTGEALDLTVLRGDKAKEGVTTPSLDDVTSWDTYLFNSTSGGEDIRKYRDLEFGGSTIYMPTFNKNADSLASDMNGTLEGPDGDMFTDEDAYKDNYVYSDGESATQGAVYDIDEDDIDEGDASMEGTNHETVIETHKAQETLDATVITMAKWLEDGSPVGPYWVYDTDGWAYWAQAIEPQTATGLLLTAIDEKENPSGEWFYAINVVSQIATAGDWGSEEDGTGFYEDGLTEDAKNLFDKVAGLIEGVALDVNILSGQVDLQVGDTMALGATVTVPSQYAGQDGYRWSITERSKASGLTQSQIDDTFQNGVFTPVSAMVGNTYVLTATSTLNFNAKDSVIVSVYDINDTSSVYMTITPETAEVESGNTLQLTGKVVGLVDSSIKWSVTGGAGTSSISTSGLLTVEETVETTLTVKVEANANAGVFKTAEIAVTIPLPSFDEIVPGSDQTVEVDGIEWYVLDEKTDAEGNEMVLIYSVGAVGTTYRFHGASTADRDSTWSTSDLRAYMNGDFIDTYLPSLKENIAETVLETPLVTNTSGNYETTTDKVFPLTMEDLGWESSASTGSTSFPTVGDALVSADKVNIGSDVWLRSPYSATVVYYVHSAGYLNRNYTNNTYAVRPALWIYL